MLTKTDLLPADSADEGPRMQWSERSDSTVVGQAALQLWNVAALTALIGTIAFFLPLVAALQPGAARWPAWRGSPCGAPRSNCGITSIAP